MPMWKVYYNNDNRKKTTTFLSAKLTLAFSSSNELKCRTFNNKTDYFFYYFMFAVW